jgi:4-carboxymuconolactone decarboxylase
MIPMIETNLSMGMMGAILPLGLAVAWAKMDGDRFPKLNPETLNKPQRRAAAEILKQSVSGLGGPWNVILRSPEMAHRLTNLLDYLRFKTSLPLRLNEFAIMITARHWSSQFEWWAHHRLAAKAGLSEAVMTDLAQGRRSEAMQPDEAIVYDFCTELHRTHFVSDDTFRKAKEMLGEQQVVDLVAVSGTYTVISMLLNAGEVLPTDGSRPLPPLAAR